MYRLRRTGLFGGYMQFGVRSYNLKEGRERTGHVGVRAPNEHRLHFGKLGLQFMHRDLAVPRRRGDYTLGQQCDPDAASRDGHVAVHALEPEFAEVQTVFIRRTDAYVSSALSAFLQIVRPDAELHLAAE